MMRAEVGETKVYQNGYRYTKTKDDGWRLTHHIIAESTLGRRVNTSQERVGFIDKDPSNLSPDNIEVVLKKNGKANRIEVIKKKIVVLQEELKFLEA